ncbi:MULTISPECIES: hypothetical protein [unclassified Dysgonomonas]|jgi:hypothetical protein|uniref:hypothetical protein n=1 Tax=unclassified Dysgonomonas TaxID=2630389 RepID=UPI0025C3CE66|nr:MULTISPECIES: hypothetical protein [unclassified Dysgonomonas]MDR2005581.1 hypothetical protein [Prevotella sp.]HMM02872.1 hypothetical protein [Dysgonomonas sp.]
MKNLLLFITFLAIIFPVDISAQGYAIGTQPTIGERFYHVGSLPKNETKPHEKLKIEILGGSLGCIYMGEQTFIISTRDGLKINREIHYGSVGNYELRIFEIENRYDFVIGTTAHFWTAIWIKSWCMRTTNFEGRPTELTPLVIKEYDPAGKVNVTDQFPLTTTLATTDIGNIGIGTTNPQAKLDVRGKIIADEIEIKINKGADFVFDTDYQLKSLSEIENFINENKHLPNIPSEREMQQNGLNLNEMQIKLLQKIEELTLHVIDLKKENDRQNEWIQKQEKIIMTLQNR